jgi:hypothetical protein
LRERGGDDAAFDLFFLAMSHARRGETVEARHYYERAVNWLQENRGALKQPAWKEELDSFRTETEALIRPQSKP